MKYSIQDIPCAIDSYKARDYSFRSLLSFHDTIMATTRVWYCCQCEDGPLSVANITGCPMCPHNKCSGCKEKTISNKRSTADIHFGKLTTNTLALENIVADATTSGIRHGYHRPAVSAYDFASLGEPTDGGDIVYRWTCCNCSGDNSYEYSPGCTDCNNHWRCGGCSVYPTKG